MTISQAIARKLTVNGGNVFNAYERNGATMPRAALKEIAQFQTANLVANTPVTIDLAQIGYSFRLMSIFLKNSPSTTAINIKVTENGTAEIDITMSVSGGFVELPYMVLSPDQRLIIELDGSAAGLILFAEQRAVVETQSLTFE